MKIKNHKNLLELLVISAGGTLVVVWNKMFLCQLPAGLGFDQQSFLFWDFAKSLNLTPYKDFFYPYGLLFFFKTDSIFWNLILILLVLVVLFFVFKVFKNIFKEHLYSYLLFFSYCFFASLFFDIDSFIRYASIIPIIYLFSETSVGKTFFMTKNGFIFGLVIGLLFFLINDIAIYSIFIFLFFLVYNFIFAYKKIDRQFFKFIFSFISGCLMGIAPLLVFLISNNAFSGFRENYALLKEVSLFAKTPFPSTLKSIENLFNLFIIVVSVIFLIEKKEKKFIYFFVLSLTLTITLYEYKNIIRASYEHISIIGFLLFLALFSEIIINFMNKKVNSKLIILTFLIVLTFFFSMIYVERNFKSRNASYVSFLSKEKCVNAKISILNGPEINSYLEVKKYLSDKDSRIFSFPGDSVFYILFNQNPPPYPSVYESTPLFAQNKQINYLKENNINFVILNTKSFAIQDGVPDKIRNKKLYEYIEKNYKEDKRIDSFIILRRN